MRKNSSSWKVMKRRRKVRPFLQYTNPMNCTWICSRQHISLLCKHLKQCKNIWTCLHKIQNSFYNCKFVLFESNCRVTSSTEFLTWQVKTWCAISQLPSCSVIALSWSMLFIILFHLSSPKPGVWCPNLCWHRKNQSSTHK